MSGEQVIAAPRDVVWKALNDEDVLRQCVPGCDQMERQSETDLTARAAIKVGPIKAKFSGKVFMSNVNPGTSYSINFEGQGGLAGFAKGAADVELLDTAEGTVLRYEASAKIGGKIAQLGARLIESTAKSMADQFFKKFSEVMQSESAVETVGGAKVPTTVETDGH